MIAAVTFFVRRKRQSDARKPEGDRAAIYAVEKLPPGPHFPLGGVPASGTASSIGRCNTDRFSRSGARRSYGSQCWLNWVVMHRDTGEPAGFVQATVVFDGPVCRRQLHLDGLAPVGDECAAALFGDHQPRTPELGDGVIDDERAQVILHLHMQGPPSGAVDGHNERSR